LSRIESVLTNKQALFIALTSSSSSIKSYSALFQTELIFSVARDYNGALADLYSSSSLNFYLFAITCYFNSAFLAVFFN